MDGSSWITIVLSEMFPPHSGNLHAIDRLCIVNNPQGDTGGQ